MRFKSAMFTGWLSMNLALAISVASGFVWSDIATAGVNGQNGGNGGNGTAGTGAATMPVASAAKAAITARPMAAPTTAASAKVPTAMLFPGKVPEEAAEQSTVAVAAAAILPISASAVVAAAARHRFPNVAVAAAAVAAAGWAER